MGRKGFNFTIEVENVKDDDEFNNNEDLKNEIKGLFRITPFPIDGAGFNEVRKFMLISGQVCRQTKNEAKAEYTIFKERLLRIIKKYYKKTKLTDIYIGNFTTIN